jgi:hypothetical protein
MTGGRQPYEQRKLPPSFASVQVDNPPFTYGGPIALRASIVAIAQASPNNYTPWQYQFVGGPQPYQPRRLIFALPRVDAPPPIPPGGGTAVTASVTATNQPSAWPYLFTGGQQPYAPTRLNPANEAGFRVDAGIFIPQFVEWKAPGRSYHFMGGWQPFAPKPPLNPTQLNIKTDLPPFSYAGRTLGILQETAYLNQPSAWPFVFGGAKQPYGISYRLNPTVEDIPQPVPGAGKKYDHTKYLPEPAWEKKPNKPYRPVWDKGGEAGKIEPPLPAGPLAYPPKSIFARRSSLNPLDSSAAAKMGLPTFNHLVPPDPQALSKRMDETRDISDAIAVLRALGLWKDQ